MKKALLAIALIIFLFSCSEGIKPEKERDEPVNQARSDNLDEYYSQIDYSCESDSDCVVKNVGNCCGYFPQCVNKGSYTDPGKVSELCQIKKMVSVCGFTDISSCKCANSKCISE